MVKRRRDDGVVLNARMGVLPDYSMLYQFCTERQLRVLKAIEKEGVRGASRTLNMNSGGLSRTVTAVEKKAALHGISPRHHMTREIAPGQMLRGVSQLYKRGEATPVLEWVKTRTDDAARAEIIEEAIAALMEEVPRAKPTNVPKVRFNADLCNLFTFTDCHVGMNAWGKQTGHDWDLKIAEDTLKGMFDYMIENSPNAETCVVAELGDFLHFDSLIAETPTHRNPLDADGRYSKVVNVAIRVLRYIIDRALEKHKKVVAVITEGNHDFVGSVWLRQAFMLLYENEPRVQFLDDELPYHSFQHGEVMLSWHHGHMNKKESLPLLFAAQFPSVWGLRRSGSYT